MPRFAAVYLAAFLLASGATIARAQTAYYERDYIVPRHEVTRIVQQRVEVVPTYPADGFYYLYDYYPPAPAYYGPTGWYDAPRHKSILLQTPFH